MKRISILIVTALLVSFSLFAQGKESQTVRITKKGTLHSVLSVEEWNNVSSLKIKGELNTEDFDFLRRQNVENLDLSGIDNKVLPAKALYGSQKLKMIILPENMVSLGIASLMHCSALQSVVLPKRLSEIHSLTFSECTSLASVELPKNVSTIGPGAFYACSSLKEIKVDDGNDKYKSLDGIVYSKDGVLVICPAGKAGLVEVDANTETIEKGAFSGCSKITKVEIPQKVKKIGDGAFWNCKSISSISLPDSILKLGNGAFQGAGLTSFVWPSILSEIPSETFKNCIYLKHIDIQEGVNAVGGSSFQGCGSLESIIFPKSLTRIGTSAFQGCVKLNDVVLPEGLYELKDEAFASCSSLRTIVVPENVSVLGVGIFAHCINLQEVIIPNSVTSIEKSAFQNCKNLKNLELPNTITSIGDGAFSGCSNLNNTLNLTNVRTLGKSVFKNCEKLQKVKFPSNLSEIPEEMFMGCVSLKSIDFPNTTIGIGDNAFRGCQNLNSVYIPEQLIIIGPGAFAECDNINSIQCLGNTPPKVGTSAFSKSTQNKATIYVPEEALTLYNENSNWNNFKHLQSNFVLNVSKAGFMSFMIPDSMWMALQNITIRGVINPKDLIFLGNLLHRGSNIKVLNLKNVEISGVEGFSLNMNLKKTNNIPNTVLREVYLPESTSRVLSYAFAGYSALETVVMPDKVKEIESHAYSNCTSLKQITLPRQLELLGSAAFLNCKSLQSIEYSGINFREKDGVLYSKDMSELLSYPCGKTEDVFEIPEGVTVIGEGACAFANFKELHLSTSVKVLKDSSFANCRNLISLIVPGNVESVGNSAFIQDSALGLVQFCEGVKSVGISAFQNCKNLETVDLASSVEVIGDYAFWDCDGIETFTNRSLAPQKTKSNIFPKRFANTGALLYVEESAKNAFKKSQTWSKFAKIESLAK